MKHHLLRLPNSPKDTRKLLQTLYDPVQKTWHFTGHPIPRGRRQWDINRRLPWRLDNILPLCSWILPQSGPESSL